MPCYSFLPLLPPVAGYEMLVLSYGSGFDVGAQRRRAGASARVCPCE